MGWCGSPAGDPHAPAPDLARRWSTWEDGAGEHAPAPQTAGRARGRQFDHETDAPAGAMPPATPHATLPAHEGADTAHHQHLSARSTSARPAPSTPLPSPTGCPVPSGPDRRRARRRARRASPHGTPGPATPVAPGTRAGVVRLVKERAEGRERAAALYDARWRKRDGSTRVPRVIRSVDDCDDIGRCWTTAVYRHYQLLEIADGRWLEVYREGGRWWVSRTNR